MSALIDALRAYAPDEGGAPLVDPDTIRDPGPATAMRQRNALENAQHQIDLESLPLPGQTPTYGQQVAQQRAQEHVAGGMNIGGITLYRGLAAPSMNYAMARKGLDLYPEQGLQLTSSYKQAAQDARAQGRTIYVGDKPIKLLSPDHDYNPDWSNAEQALFDQQGRLPKAIALAQRGIAQRQREGLPIEDYHRQMLDDLKSMSGKVRVEDQSVVQPFDLPDRVMNNMLDWDTPMHSQLPVVQQRFSGRPFNDIDATPKDILEPQMYHGFTGPGTGLHSISPLLEDLNIPGFKYSYTRDPTEQSVVLGAHALDDLTPMNNDVQTQSIIDVLRNQGGQ